MNLTFLIALIGSTFAALWDLKTTEIPDELPKVLMIFGASYFLFHSIAVGNLSYFVISLLVGTIFLLFGYLMYYLGQWGAGDAEVLAAIGYLLPFGTNLFDYACFLFSVFLVGIFYILIYSFLVSVRNRKVKLEFVNRVKKVKYLLLATNLTLFLLVFTTLYSLLHDLLYSLKLSLSSIILADFFYLFVIYGKLVEKICFIKKIPVSKLKVGDVLLESKLWEGINETELSKIKKRKKYVWIKEGIRFAGVFPITLLLYYFQGCLFFSVLNFINYFL